MTAPLRAPLYPVDGAGNRFVLVDLLDVRDPGAFDRAVASARGEAAALTCVEGGSRADGLLLVGPARDTGDASATLVVVNRDGSRPEMCGNGLRCAAVHVARRTGARSGAIATDAGPRAFEVLADDGAAARVRVTMGAARALGEVEAAAAPGRTFHRVDVGNPHAVCVVGAEEDPAELARRLGPGVERDAVLAPEGANVGFLSARALAVWERGVGLTEACGTGACAAASVAVRLGLAPSGVEVRMLLPGGPLGVTVPRDGGAELSLTGPARVAARPLAAHGRRSVAARPSAAGGE